MRFLFALALFFVPSVLHAATQVYNDRAIFEAQSAIFVLDDYENPGYANHQTDSEMDAVLNETRYLPTGFPGSNYIYAPNVGLVYCAGCNGSYQMDFRFTSVSGTNGVDTVGFDYTNAPQLPYTAFVGFGDGSTANYPLASTNPEVRLFFGITSDLEIATIHLGLANGVATQQGYFDQDNLLVGRLVPEPSGIALLMVGMLGICRRLSR